MASRFVHDTLRDREENVAPGLAKLDYVWPKPINAVECPTRRPSAYLQCSQRTFSSVAPPLAPNFDQRGRGPLLTRLGAPLTGEGIVHVPDGHNAGRIVIGAPFPVGANGRIEGGQPLTNRIHALPVKGQPHDIMAQQSVGG